ncbi:PaaI family thioesterase [Actinomycetospora sp. NBRC 106378]|uniref:PaaI family thioesterase n=1 Tax=Actinomycetospora sp. NBRC 106378 TaxID=3032208 RepID=UPI0024A504C2|nr:PaaI family thioesterase [Actinomycetospora sp. NBRC 106378]GLZ52171.1 hypothetical protein Acsp07_17880 [Actinomycetospora sp. NBRC 106378]
MTAPNPDYDAFIRRVIATMPALRSLGIEVVDLAPGHAEVRLPERAELAQHDGYVQGGLIGTLADVAGGCATATLLPAGWVGMTADYTVKLVAPARGTLTARGRVVSARRTTSVAAADVLDADGTVCATALVTMRNVDTGR